MKISTKLRTQNWNTRGSLPIKYVIKLFFTKAKHPNFLPRITAELALDICFEKQMLSPVHEMA